MKLHELIIIVFFIGFATGGSCAALLLLKHTKSIKQEAAITLQKAEHLTTAHLIKRNHCE